MPTCHTTLTIYYIEMASFKTNFLLIFRITLSDNIFGLFYFTTGPKPITNVLQYQRNATITLIKKLISKAVAYTRMTVCSI